MLIVLHNQCLITACLMRGLEFNPKRYEIGDDLFFFGDNLCNYGEEAAQFGGARTYYNSLGVQAIKKVGNHWPRWTPLLLL